MYQMRCTRPEVEAMCRRLSCVHPTICKLLGTDHGPLVQLMQAARAEPGVKKVLVASGIRMDLARRSPEYMRELAAHHVGGHLKVAPEHTDPDVLALMKKPAPTISRSSASEFQQASQQAGKKQYLVPYFIASHPGSTLDAMIDLAVFLKRNRYRPDQVQDFIPSPFDIAACMYHTGLDPFTKKPVLRRQAPARPQAAAGPDAVLQAGELFRGPPGARSRPGRSDLIGSGCDCLIPDRPPKEALDRRRKRANEVAARADRRRPHSVQPGRLSTPARRPRNARDAAASCSRGLRPRARLVAGVCDHPGRPAVAGVSTPSSASQSRLRSVRPLFNFRRCSPPTSINCSTLAAGRKLERFGPYVLDRPAPAAGHAAHRATRALGAGRRALRPHRRPDAASGRSRDQIDRPAWSIQSRAPDARVSS